MYLIRYIFLVSLLSLITVSNYAQNRSALWGNSGELWTPESRLPDFSHAGYSEGEKKIPFLPIKVNVKNFGAKGDGHTDDTKAFLAAIEACNNGAVWIPAGKYVLNDMLKITKSNLVLRGAGVDKTILYFPISLTDVLPDWTLNGGGKRTSNYSWSGGIINFKGDYGTTLITNITSPTKYGSNQIQVEDTKGLKIGQRIEIYESDPADNSLTKYLYRGDAGDISGIGATVTQQQNGSSNDPKEDAKAYKRPRVHASIVVRITGINGKTITFNRPLRFDIETRWTPVINSFSPTVSNSGIESFSIQFPNQPYMGHFTELGFNPLCFKEVSDCWAKDITILDADSGPNLYGKFCTLDNVIIESLRKKDKEGKNGHHGISAYDDDNLIKGFKINTTYIHDISVEHSAGNVFMNGKGINICFDHHKVAPYGNCFTNIDIGIGSRPWWTGGASGLGKSGAALATFWGLQSAKPLNLPPVSFSPNLINLVGISTTATSITEKEGKWVESGVIYPLNIYEAQVAKRLGTKFLANDEPKMYGKPVELDINPSEKYQQLEGWGASICWWGNSLGGWSEKNLDTILAQVCSPNELNMNIFRFNIGGGDDPTHIGGHMCKGMGARAEMPGYKASADAPYNFENDANQRKVLLKIKQLRPDAIFEAFSNSPPYWMTKTGCSSGGINGGSNLKPEFQDAFVDYLTEVAAHYNKKYNIGFRTLAPFNESSANWWKNLGTQEGCHFDAKEQVEIIRKLAKKIKDKGLNIGISANDDSWLSQFNESMSVYKKNSDIFPLLSQINTHTYNGTAKEKEKAGAFIKKTGKRFWMSESGPSGIKDKSGFEINLIMADRIVEDLHHLKTVAWIDWQIFEERSEVWCMFSGDIKKQHWVRVKNMYVREQFSKFIPAGYSIIGAINEHVLAATSPDNKKVVLVIVNNTQTEIEYTFHLKSDVHFAQYYRTSSSENCEEIKDEGVEGNSLVYPSPPMSVTTIVMQ